MALKRHSDAAETPNKDSSGWEPEIKRIVLAHANGRPRSVQTTIGPSQAGSPCEREILFRLTGSDTKPDSNPWLPYVGTAVHVSLAEALEEENRRLGRARWLIEHRVRISDEIPGGTLDAYDTDTATVFDWKIVGATTLKYVQAHGSKPGYRQQIDLYGLGLAREGYQVNDCAIVYLPRNASPVRPFLDEMRVDKQPFNIDGAVETVRRVERIAAKARGISPATRAKKVNEHPAAPSKDNCYFCSHKASCNDAV